ncbi:sensor histidine kinase [Poseidonocella sedimentorum]|uniref:histidine kinase n=1 Tax=Poseidonocella sedimentorum TaxID=871652 RepID=A0A1I6DT58_9RHOB|nr:HAMP domain-containing sensor histidine kinase [Poseidonocella sedimentorum]SFR08498.1 hypothetical protein SAMN04515673_10578 [Poseidonocella sedimentorum]
MRGPLVSLKTRLGLGAAALGLVALLAAGITISGHDMVARRITASLDSEQRIAQYAELSTQVSSLIIVATEAVQTGLAPATRAARLAPIERQITATFSRLRDNLETAVSEAQSLGLDEQSRRATQSLGLARMEAQLQSTMTGLTAETTDRDRLKGYIDSFARGFDPLLNGVINEERRRRFEIIAGIAELRGRLIALALSVSAATLLLLALAYLGLLRPLFRRLDLLRGAAQRVGREDFAIALPEGRGDEIDVLFAETNRMAGALAERQAHVDAEWTQLNQTIAERTEALRNAVTELAEIDENRRRFFADISHELRTPLTVILMETEIGAKGANDPAESFNTIRARALRLNRRIDDLLRIARSESGALELEAEPIDLGQILDDAVADMRPQIDSAGMVLTVLKESETDAVGDANWLRQIVCGLIQNACRHARSSGKLQLEAGSRGKQARLSVIDAGPGIAPEDREEIFDRFRQGRSAARSEGFGIGLAFARWVVEQQGGTIALDSPAPDGDGNGTRVTITLPRPDPGTMP